MIAVGLICLAVIVVFRFLDSVDRAEEAALHERLLREQRRVKDMQPGVWLRELPEVTDLEGAGRRAQGGFNASEKHNRRGVLV